MRIASIASALVLFLAVAGCAKEDRVLSRFEPNRPLPLAATADEPGQYLLYAADTPNPIYRITLVRRARFGFRSIGGQVVAFAQRQNTSAGKPLLEDIEIPLPGGDHVGYYWKYQAPKDK
ncbi:MAG TPA: hypothetical protein VGN72_16270 [Tepidisphaeraceae bacterium]|jgi:hypothetical protein|nr:hypothetical protein [Tepidisphaeraceae bacterium]